MSVLCFFKISDWKSHWTDGFLKDKCADCVTKPPKNTKRSLPTSFRTLVRRYFVFLKKVNRMPIFIRFLTKESLVSYPYSVKKYVSFLKKILCSHAHISNKSTFSQTQSSLMSFIFFIFCKKPMLSYPYLVKKAANLPEQQTTLCHGLKK